MNKLKRFFDLVPAMLLWLMLSIFLWGFVFNILTDVPAGEKIALFIDAPLTDETSLAVSLEKSVGDGIRMVQVRPFSYAMMSSEALEAADLYIIGESSIETYRAWLAPLPEELQTGEVLSLDGQPLGVKVFDAATGEGVAAEHIGYAHPSKALEDHYLCIGVNSLHVQSHENAQDNEAIACALALLH